MSQAGNDETEAMRGASRAGDSNLDPDEVARFERNARNWWDPDGPFRTLHVINPVRTRYVEGATAPAGKDLLDVGCGGGLLTEALCRGGARVTGLDGSPGAIAVAEAHRRGLGLEIEYLCTTAGELAAGGARHFDVITCMELLEHVPDPVQLLRDLKGLLRPGGDIVVSTLNRSLKAFLGAIVAGEYLFSLLPRGTHSYARFIRPSELDTWLRGLGFEVLDIAGIRYLPWVEHCSISNDCSVNYILHARLPG